MTTTDTRLELGARRGRPVAIAFSIVFAALAAGCAADPAPGLMGLEPSRLGAASHSMTDRDADAHAPRVSPSKVLSAIVFERVTGSPVDPARLIER